MATQSSAILRRKMVQLKTGIPASSMYALIKTGRFPTPINLGPRSVGWLESEIDAWIAERTNQRAAIGEKGSARQSFLSGL